MACHQQSQAQPLILQPARFDEHEWVTRWPLGSPILWAELATDFTALFCSGGERPAVDPAHQIQLHISKQNKDASAEQDDCKGCPCLSAAHAQLLAWVSTALNLGPRFCCCHSRCRVSAFSGFRGGSCARTGTFPSCSRVRGLSA